MSLPSPHCPSCGHSTAWEKRTEVAFYYGPSAPNGTPSFFVLEAMRRLAGVNAHHFECRGDPKAHGRADLRVCVDWGEDLTEYAAFLPEPPRAYWALDTHTSEAARAYQLAKADKMDFVWYSSMQDEEIFQKVMRGHGIDHYRMTCEWLPYAAEPTLWKPAEREDKRWDLGWIGRADSYGARTEFLSVLLDEFGDRFRFTLDRKMTEDAVSWLQPCWFMVNHCQSDSTNMRTFEGMALGAVVLQPETSDLKKLGFMDAVHLVTYRNLDEAIEKVRYWRCRPLEMAWIGMNARSAILNRHTWVHRAARIAELANWVAPAGAVDRAIALPPWALLETRTWEGNV